MIIIHRQNNKWLQRSGDVPHSVLKDMTFDDVVSPRLGEVKAAADQLVVALRALERIVGSGYMLGHRSNIPLAEAEAFAEAIAIGPGPPRPSKASRGGGRPHPGWHEAARQIARRIKSTMREVEYRGRLREQDHESVTTIVGAHAITWAYGITVAPRGFAQAMTPRDRRSTKPPKARSWTTRSTRT